MHQNQPLELYRKVVNLKEAVTTQLVKIPFWYGLAHYIQYILLAAVIICIINIKYSSLHKLYSPTDARQRFPNEILRMKFLWMTN